MEAEKLFLLFHVLFLQFSFCTSHDSINTSQTIKDGDLLISKGNKFALGFFSPGSSSYRYLGIWYHQVAEKTVVWVANRNNPITGSSSGLLFINQYGNLVLNGNPDHKVPVWSTNVSGEGEANFVARLLNSGNLILVHETSREIVWQSFHYPTNSQVPGMKLGLDRNTGIERFLTSWRSADDPGIGDFSIRINPNGSPQLFLYKGTISKPSWRSTPWPWRRQPSSLIDKNFVSNQEEISNVYTVPDDSPDLLTVLDHSGVLKSLTWHEGDSQWKEVWKAPQFRCDTYGQCGAYSICRLDFSSFECACLPGYKPRNPKEWFMRDGSGGCVRKRLETSSMCGHGEGFVKLQKVLLPDTSNAVWLSMNKSPADCEQECKRNCSISAYASIEVPGEGTGCLAWYGELIDSKYDEGESYDLHVRVDVIELAENARKSNSSYEKKKKNLAILGPSVASAWLIIMLFAYLWLRNRAKEVHLVPIEFQRSSSDTHLEVFRLSAISAATNNFSTANKLGQGGFGSVYKGILPNGQEVAVKRLSTSSGQGIEELKNEITVIAKLQHRNLVKLRGYCIQGGEKMLIYEYLPNKSLDSFLFEETRRLLLDWRKRFNIIVGIARGILYLHQDSRLRIIHRDLKCSNIQLDAEMNPKISDFGMAKIFENELIQDRTSRVVGTYGYMSPEYVMFGQFSVKSDVFSFGVMLLEIISGKKNNRFYQQDPPLSLIGYVWELWREERALEIVDSSMEELYHPQEALKCIQIGLLCVQEDALDRPSMLAVVFMLNNSETSIPFPKQPAFFFSESGKIPDIAVDVEDGPGSVNELTITAISSR